MRKNVASQVVAFQMISATDGSNVTSGTPTVYYTIDGGIQGTGGGTSTHEGNGQWSYVPTQAETNGDHVAFTMVLTGAISQTINVYPVSFDYTDSVRMGLTALPNAAADAAGGLPISDAGGLDLDAVDTNVGTLLTRVVGTIATGMHNPQSGDAYTRLGAPAGASVSADIASVQADTDAIEVDTQDIQSRLPAALVGGLIDANVGAISTNTTAADNLELQYDGTGLTGDTYPSTQAQLSSVVVDVLRQQTVRFDNFQPTGTISNATFTSSIPSGARYELQAITQWDIGSFSSVSLGYWDSSGVWTSTGWSGLLNEPLALYLDGDTYGVTFPETDITFTITNTNGNTSTITLHVPEQDTTFDSTYAFTKEGYPVQVNNAIVVGTQAPSLTATDVDTVWDEVLSGHTTAGTTGATLTTASEKTGHELSAAGVDAILDEVVEGTTTLRQYLRGIAAVLLGESTGGGTATINFENADTPGTNRVTATVDANGNRTAVTLNL